jgi:6-phosphogluconate dehydrogenase
MQLAMIGLGRMGGNMVERLLKGGHQVVVYDRSADAVKASVGKGAKAATNLADVVKQLATPRVIWIMVPAGQPVEDTIAELVPQLSKGDILIDGGNSNFKDSIRRAEMLAAKGLEFVDAGTSGGVCGVTLC